MDHANAVMLRRSTRAALIAAAFIIGCGAPPASADPLSPLQYGTPRLKSTVNNAYERRRARIERHNEPEPAMQAVPLLPVESPQDTTPAKASLTFGASPEPRTSEYGTAAPVAPVQELSRKEIKTIADTAPAAGPKTPAKTHVRIPDPENIEQVTDPGTVASITVLDKQLAAEQENIHAARPDDEELTESEEYSSPLVPELPQITVSAPIEPIVAEEMPPPNTTSVRPTPEFAEIPPPPVAGGSPQLNPDQVSTIERALNTVAAPVSTAISALGDVFDSTQTLVASVASQWQDPERAVALYTQPEPFAEPETQIADSHGPTSDTAPVPVVQAVDVPPPSVDAKKNILFATDATEESFEVATAALPPEAQPPPPEAFSPKQPEQPPPPATFQPAEPPPELTSAAAPPPPEEPEDITLPSMQSASAEPPPAPEPAPPAEPLPSVAENKAKDIPEIPMASMGNADREAVNPPRAHSELGLDMLPDDSLAFYWPPPEGGADLPPLPMGSADYEDTPAEPVRLTRNEQPMPAPEILAQMAPAAAPPPPAQVQMQQPAVMQYPPPQIVFVQQPPAQQYVMAPPMPYPYPYGYAPYPYAPYPPASYPPQNYPQPAPQQQAEIPATAPQAPQAMLQPPAPPNGMVSPGPVVDYKRSSIDLTNQQNGFSSLTPSAGGHQSTFEASIRDVSEIAPTAQTLSDLAPSANGKYTGGLPTGSAPDSAAMPTPLTGADNDKFTYSLAASEPTPTLTDNTRKTISAIPSNLDKKEPDPVQKISVRRRNTVPVKDKRVDVALNLNKPSFDTQYELERAYNALIAGNSEDALALYRRVIDADAENKQALFGLAATYHRLGQLEKARPYYSKLLKLEPTHREALNNFLALAAEEAPQEALQELLYLEQRNPEFSPIPAQIAQIYQKLGRNEEAVDKMVRAVSLAPENLTYRYNLAILFDKLGKREEAASMYKMLIDANKRGEVIPGNAAKIQERLTYLRSNSSS